MTKTYSSDVPSLEPAELDDAMLLAIGRLTRLVTDIESLVTLYLCRLFGLTEAKIAILLGQMALSQRLKLVRSGASANGPEEAALAKSWFTHDSLTMVIDARNAVAHGTLIGKTSDDQYAFRVLKALEVTEGKLTTEVVLYSASVLIEHVEAGARGLAAMPAALKLEALLETRRKQPLGPHPKAAPVKKRTGGHSRPPQS